MFLLVCFLSVCWGSTYFQYVLLTLNMLGMLWVSLLPVHFDYFLYDLSLLIFCTFWDYLFPVCFTYFLYVRYVVSLLTVDMFSLLTVFLRTFCMLLVCLLPVCFAYFLYVGCESTYFLYVLSSWASSSFLFLSSSCCLRRCSFLILSNSSWTHSSSPARAWSGSEGLVGTGTNYNIEKQVNKNPDSITIISSLSFSGKKKNQNIMGLAGISFFNFKICKEE